MGIVGEKGLEGGDDTITVEGMTVDETELLAERDKFVEVRRPSLSESAQPRLSASDSSNT